MWRVNAQHYHLRSRALQPQNRIKSTVRVHHPTSPLMLSPTTQAAHSLPILLNIEKLATPLTHLCKLAQLIQYIIPTRAKINLLWEYRIIITKAIMTSKFVELIRIRRRNFALRSIWRLRWIVRRRRSRGRRWLIRHIRYMQLNLIIRRIGWHRGHLAHWRLLWRWYRRLMLVQPRQLSVLLSQTTTLLQINCSVSIQPPFSFRCSTTRTTSSEMSLGWLKSKL